ncbi:kinesin-like protein KIF20B isoform X2 [Melanotaenia boesemani]|uniref:kinesin-like protein KIF20B isoform X2 n=1 Tax=Melanotaenia boesemani TaxID=1250792 RepID=UPI001C0510DE|nr:kinesin-like protein KIF20B isoform X2 [Melanotaenia boesemani]
MTDSCLVGRAGADDDVERDFSSEPETQHSCIEEREHLQVYLRIRPFTSAERSDGESQDCVAIEPPDVVLLKPPSLSLSARLSTDRSLPQTGQHFQFSQVYGPETTQRELFEGTVKDLVKDVMEGGNSLVFTYGVTNAGKTFTFLGPDADPGVLPRSLDVVFSSIGEQIFSGMSIKPQRCREFVRLSEEQQAKEAAFKRNLLRQFKESEKSNVGLLNGNSKTSFEVSSVSGTAEAAEDKISLKVKTNTKFSVWVSFCEIYNENIHDLLEVTPSVGLRRAALRLSQDVKGNAFIKDLRWVEVKCAEEAYEVLKLGKKNQSFSSTRLNRLSSRSHSIFSIRILRIEDVGTPRVHAVSELCLCDLAGSERCAKTQNQGERLKEAGNINTSLLILGKCINALRHNQQARLLQHVPFRESKLTHYLQGFFCGRGKACMIVNINQCASMYDETLNVLRFSAVAQKVVVLPSRPVTMKPQTSTSDASFILDAERNALRSSRRSSLIGWESNLEDVQEDEDDEDDEEISLTEDSVDQSGNREDDKIVIERKTHQRLQLLVKQLQIQLKKERAENLILEAEIREEMTQDFTRLFSNMQNYYEERLAREGEILEERAERRLELFRNLVKKMSGADEDADAVGGVLDSDASQLADRKSLQAAPACSSRAVPQAEMKMHEQEVLKHIAAEVDDDGEKRRVLLLLQEKSSEVARLEKQLREQKTVEADPHQTDELQEALAALEKERRLREDTVAALQYQTLGKEEALASLQEEKKAKEEAIVTREELRQLKEETVTSLEEERRDKEKALVALEAERRAKEEAVAALEEEKNSKEEEEEDVCRLQEEEEGDELRQLKDLLEAAECQVMRMQSAEQCAQARLEEQSKQIQEKSSEISTLMQEVQRLKQELQTAMEDGTTRQHYVLGLESELEQFKQQLAHKELLSEQQLENLTEKLNQTEAASKQQVDELKKKLLEREETLQEEDALSKQKLEELEQKLREQKETSSKVSEEAEDVKRMNSDLQTELTSLKAKLSNMEGTEEASRKTAAAQMEKMKEMERQLEGTLAEQEQASALREAELQTKLLEMETQITSLQKSLKEAQERQEEEESQAVQEARRREVERRRELLAVAHEAIAQKDEELEKKTQEINRLKETSQQDAEKVKNLELHLQRKEEDSSDLREKLADYKKQIQQVQKEISATREEEKVLRQKLCDLEKTKKQLQTDLASRDRTIQQLKVEQTSTKSDDTLQLYQKTCEDLKAKERVMEDMRLALTEQEDTQQQMEQVLDEKLGLIQELSSEVEKLKGLLLQERGNTPHTHVDRSSDELRRAKEETSRAQEDLKVLTEKHQAERRKWLEEKLLLIGQAKEAEDKRNQEMKKFAEDRERCTRQQSHLAQLLEKDQTMEKWRKERDALVAALEVQLQKLLSSQAEKDKVIQQLGLQPPPEVDGGPSVAELQEALNRKEVEILHLKDELKASAAKQDDTVTQTKSNGGSVRCSQQPKDETMKTESERRETRASVSSRASAGFPSVLDSSEISTENGRMSRFPRPELEISFSPLQPNRMALRRQGEESAVTIKIPQSGRKRKSSEMEKSFLFRRSKRRTTREEEVETANRRNTKTKVTPKRTPHKEESSSPAGCHDSPNSIRSRKDGALLKIGDFLQSSPTLFSSKAKKMMSLVSGRSEADSAASSSSLSLRGKKGKKKLYRPEISSPMDIPAPIISREPEEKESHHESIKRRLRTRVAK